MNTTAPMLQAWDRVLEMSPRPGAVTQGRFEPSEVVRDRAPVTRTFGVTRAPRQRSASAVARKAWLDVDVKVGIVTEIELDQSVSSRDARRRGPGCDRECPCSRQHERAIVSAG